MELEAFISFFLLLHLRKTLNTFSPDAEWNRRLKYGMIAVGVFFVVDGAIRGNVITQWIWHLVVLYIISLGFRELRFFPTRMSLYAVLPYVILSFLSSVLILVVPSWKLTVDRYEDYAHLVAITWMVALLILSQRQIKALKVEHRKRLQEEEELRRSELRKAELEALVAERTAELVQQKEELHLALEHLKSTQDQLIQREKMASLGELTAGIAHEIKNPLNFVNNFAELSVDLAEELQDQVSALPVAQNEKEELSHLLTDLIQNQKKIHYHGNRADAIVKNMLMHSQKSTGKRELTNINALADEYLRLTYHGIRAKDKSFTASLQTSFDENAGAVSVVPQEIGRVLINLFNNAFYAVQEKKKKGNGTFEPKISVATRKKAGSIEVIVNDNGPGIPEHALEKIFQPFFTTKPTGEGTGLGLSLSYDIITKGHNGKLNVHTKEGEGTEFKIILPAESI
jgi:two-component system, NtrC family, sensor kinase